MEGGEGFANMAVGVGLGGEDVAENALPVNDIRCAAGDDAEGAPDAVHFADTGAGIAEEREGQMVFRGETGVRFGGIGADTEDFGAVGFEIRELVAKSTGFFGAAGGVVLRVEEDHDGRLVAEAAEANGVAVLAGEFEIRRELAGLEFIHGRKVRPR